MKHPGTITLYNEHGTRLSFYAYADRFQRQFMINYWQSMFGDRFKKFYYHIEPDTYEEQIRKIA